MHIRGILVSGALLGAILTACGDKSGNQPLGEVPADQELVDRGCEYLELRLADDADRSLNVQLGDTSEDILTLMREQCGDEVAKAERVVRAYRKQRRDRKAKESPTPSVEAEPSPNLNDEDHQLTALGLNSSDVVALGRVADVTGYGLGPGTTLTYEQAYDFALGITGVCEWVADGTSTWEAQIADDISTGAPESAARQFNGYLETSFCPLLS